MALPVLLVSFMISALGWVFFTSFFLHPFSYLFFVSTFLPFLEILFYYYDLLGHLFLSTILLLFIYNSSFCTHIKFCRLWITKKKALGKEDDAGSEGSVKVMVDI